MKCFSGHSVKLTDLGWDGYMLAMSTSEQDLPFLFLTFFFLNHQFFFSAIKKNALEDEGFIFVQIFRNGYVHWMAMVDGIFGLIKEVDHGIQISVKFHVLTLNLRLFRLPHIFLSLLLY
jgi:hypothetical protein